MATKQAINLLPKDNFDQTGLGKAVKWATTFGRWIVIIVDLLVIGSFLSRFYFDTKLADYHDEIKQQQVIVESATDFEATFRSLQKRLALIKSLANQKFGSESKLLFLTKILPPEVVLKNLQIDEEKITFSGNSSNQEGFEKLTRNLLASPQTKSINLSQLSIGEKNKEGLVSFNFSVVWKGL